MPRSKKLIRQISRYLGSPTAEQDLANLSTMLKSVSPDVLPPGAREALAKIPVLFDIIDEAYAKYEDNLAIASHILAVSTDELMEANRSIHLMVNSLGQGFLMFDKSGTCSSIYSLACEHLLGTMPAGKPIASVLHLDGEKMKRFTSLLHFAFDGSHAMSFEEIVHFAPKSFTNAAGRHIRLAYKPERSAAGDLEQIILIATDVTEQIRAEELAQERKDLFQSIESVLRDRHSFGSYIRRAYSFVEQLPGAMQANDLSDLHRELHTLKGGAGAFRLIKLMNAMHDAETAVSKLPDTSSVVPRLHAIDMQQALLKEELDDVVARFKNLLGINVLALEAERTFSKATIYDFAYFLIDHGQSSLYEDYIRLVCTQSLKDYLRRFDLTLRDLADRFNKRVFPLAFTGEDISIILDPYQALFDSFIHIFRNIMDHGIESPYTREFSGKCDTGKIEIDLHLNGRATHQRVIMEFKDDGAGIDVATLRAKLIEQHPADHWDTRADDEVLNSIFTEKLSTSNAVTLYSGRGMGLSAVYEEVKKVKGSISIRSIPGKETILRLEFPYVLKL